VASLAAITQKRRLLVAIQVTELPNLCSRYGAPIRKRLSLGTFWGGLGSKAGFFFWPAHLAPFA
jgi:hypothetical protein